MSAAARFETLMRAVMAGNDFYRRKYEPLEFVAARPPRYADLPNLPYTTKQELVEDSARHPPYGSNLTFPIDAYVRVHQTSGTSGRPLRWLDTAESWSWWLDCWLTVYRAAGVTAGDRIFLAFSFGPFVGFWAAFEAGQRLGALMIPGGGMGSKQRLEAMIASQASVLVSTPTYALRLAEVAQEAGLDLVNSGVRTTIHAGEPGASIPNVRGRIEAQWGARCVDHVGATEVGAWGFGCGQADHVHINEDEFIAEVIPRDPSGDEIAGLEIGELVLTNLGRIGSPVVRYRTGDHVELVRDTCPCGRSTAFLPGGVLGRVDDMLIVRGINVFPSALENIIREDPAVREFEVEVRSDREMMDLAVRVEADGADGGAVADRLRERIRDRLGLRVAVDMADPGSLPRYELKARRFKFT